MTEKDAANLQDKLTTGLKLQQQNEISQAIAIFEEILTGWPHQPDALHALGMAYIQQRQFTQALPFLSQAVIHAPHIPEFHNNLANAYKHAGRSQEALQHYHEALRLKANYPQAHNNLGTLLYQLGKYEEAKDHFQKAIRIDPMLWDAHYNLANTYVQLDRLTDAAAHFKEVLKLRPEHLGALHNLGIILCNLKDFQGAKPPLMTVVAHEPDNIDALFHLGVIYSALAQAQEALTCYQKVLHLQPEHAHAHHNMATIYLHLNQTEQALAHYQRAYALEPSNKTALHMVSALTGQPSEQGAPLEYTRALFDQYAYNYEEHVKKLLKYRVPSLLREMIAPLASQIPQPCYGLDLGCGTGLCAPLFADVVAKLVGVDVSPNMIEIARQHGGYYKLHNTDILSYLAQQDEKFDLIIAADVLVYFGSLADLFAACRKVLKEKGLWCFSIEDLTHSETHNALDSSGKFTSFSLQKSGRYAHHAHYIENLAAKHHFVVSQKKHEIIRYQADSPVKGILYMLQAISP